MEYSVPTVRVVSPVTDENPTGFIVINQSDYDHTVHETWTLEPAHDEPPAKRRPKSE